MKSYRIAIVTFIILVNSISLAFCQDINLAWDASPTADVDGYKVYYKQGDSSFPFDGVGANEGASPVDVGNALYTTLTGLNDDVAYFFSVTAYQDSGTESTYSNIVSSSDSGIVSSSWLPTLIIPGNNATNEPIPVTFRWETAPSGYDVTYTLYYGTDQNEVTAAGSLVTLPPSSGGTPIPNAFIVIAVMLLLTLIKYRPLVPIKAVSPPYPLLLVGLLAGMLTACGGGGGGDESTTDRAAISTETAATESVLYSVNIGSDDYHQAYDLTASTTYFWKVVATDTQDPNLTYESEVRTFTTEAF